MINDDVRRVLFITGWHSGNSDYQGEQALISRCFPGAEIERFPWESMLSWEDSLGQADNDAPRDLKKRLASFSAYELKRTYLIGHSLGARIAVNALINTRRVIGGLLLMGAAIDANSSSVEQASKYVAAKVVNLFSPTDIVLEFYLLTNRTPAFGQQAAEGSYTNDIYVNMKPLSKSLKTMFLTNLLLSTPPFGTFRTLKTIRQVIATANGIKSYIEGSHCFLDYIQAWYDYET